MFAGISPTDWVERMGPWIRTTATSFCKRFPNDTQDLIQDSSIEVMRLVDVIAKHPKVNTEEEATKYVKASLLNFMRKSNGRMVRLYGREVACSLDESDDDDDTPHRPTVAVDSRDDFQDLMTEMAMDHMKSMLSDLECSIFNALLNITMDPQMQELLRKEMDDRKQKVEQGLVKFVLPILAYGPPAWLIAERFDISKNKARQALTNIKAAYERVFCRENEGGTMDGTLVRS